MSSTRTRALLLAVACSGIIGLAGCGGEDSSPEGTSSDIRGQAEDAIRSLLEAGGTPDDQIDCVIENLPDYSDEEYEEIVDSYEKRGGAPSVAADVGTATVDCMS